MPGHQAMDPRFTPDFHSMTKNYQFHSIARTRIPTFDIFAVGLRKHHIAAILEFDVTESRTRLRSLRKNGTNVSFNAWLVKTIARVVQKHPEAAAYLHSKKRLIIFNDINVSMIVEKETGGNKVPMPVVIEKANEKSLSQITQEIQFAREQVVNPSDIVLTRKSTAYQRIYYHLPGWFRRLFWSMLLKIPGAAYKTMGNVAVTSVGMTGRINGWFIHRSVHPVSFGVGSVIQKPVVKNNEIKIREILNMTILADHDVMDGAPMVRFLNDLTQSLETGEEITPE